MINGVKLSSLSRPAQPATTTIEEIHKAVVDMVSLHYILKDFVSRLVCINGNFSIKSRITYA